MAHSKAYMDLMNSKRWKQVRALKLQQVGGYCELCTAEGWHDLQAVAIDVHHKIPIESATSMEEMKRLCYSLSNLQALCVRHHIQVHAEQESHSKEAHMQREEERLNRWKERMKTKPSPTDLYGK